MLFDGLIQGKSVQTKIIKSHQKSHPQKDMKGTSLQFFMIYLSIFGGMTNYINVLSTFPTQNAKRTFRNACSERRGVFNGFMDPRSFRILFLRPAKRIHSRFDHLLKDRMLHQSRASQSNGSPGAKLAGFNLHNSFKTRQKRIRLWPAKRFLKALKKGSVFGLPSAF